MFLEKSSWGKYLQRQMITRSNSHGFRNSSAEQKKKIHPHNPSLSLCPVCTYYYCEAIMHLRRAMADTTAQSKAPLHD